MALLHVSHFAFFLALLTALPARAEILINELMAAGSERLLRWSPAGVPVLGSGTPWYTGGFNDLSWQTGTGPFGFGSFTNASPAPVIATDTATHAKSDPDPIFAEDVYRFQRGCRPDQSAAT